MGNYATIKAAFTLAVQFMDLHGKRDSSPQHLRQLLEMGGRLLNLHEINAEKYDGFVRLGGSKGAVERIMDAVRILAMLRLRLITQRMVKSGDRVIGLDGSVPLGAGAAMARRSHEIRYLLDLLGDGLDMDQDFSRDVALALILADEAGEVEARTVNIQDFDHVAEARENHL